MKDYTFEKFFVDLRDGYILICKYYNKNYEVYKITNNAYKVKDFSGKSSRIVTLQVLRDMFFHMSDIEYKVDKADRTSIT